MRRDCDQHGLGLKATRTILLCPSETRLTSLFHAWRSWQAVKNFGHICMKTKKPN